MRSQVDLGYGDATLAFHPAEQDSAANLPVNAVLDAVVFQGDMMATQSHVLADP